MRISPPPGWSCGRMSWPGWPPSTLWGSDPGRRAGSTAVPRRSRPAEPTEAAMPDRIPAFDEFVAGLRETWATETDPQQRMEGAQPLLVQLLRDDELFA